MSVVALAAPVAAASHGTRLLPAIAMWMTMMVVMMLPSVLPWLRGFAALSRDRESGSLRPGWVTLFGSGYFAVWLGFSVMAAWLQLGLRSAGALGPDVALAAPLGGAALIGAGLYQAAPLKAACLEHCRTPLGYFLAHWRNGPGGAFRMGASHGAFCVGCCWALMLAGFALGVMNLAWMALLTVVISVETLVPGGDRIGRLMGVGMVVWGVALF